MDWQTLGIETYSNGIELIEHVKWVVGPLATDTTSPICWMIEDFREVLLDLKIAIVEDHPEEALNHIEEAMRIFADLLSRLKDYES